MHIKILLDLMAFSMKFAEFLNLPNKGEANDCQNSSQFDLKVW